MITLATILLYIYSGCSVEFITQNEELRRLPRFCDEVDDFPLVLQDGLCVYFSLSTKGNGTLCIDGETFHVYDSHDDGQVYQNGWSDLVRISLPHGELWVNACKEINTGEKEPHMSKESIVDAKVWMRSLFGSAHLWNSMPD